MAARTSEQQELETLTTIGSIVDAYEEIAATRIRKTRDQVLKTRSFLDEIKLVFEQLRASYEKEVEQLIRKKKGKKSNSPRLLSHNGRKLHVFLSSNTGLYGDVVRRTFEYFEEKLAREAGDVAIVGRFGDAIFKQVHPNLKYQFFEMSDNEVDPTQIKPLVEYMLDYETVIVYFGRFENLIKQEIVGYDVSANVTSASKREEMRLAKYIFEPSLEKILEFFEHEIFASIAEQTVRESQLGKFASRMVALDRATANISKRIEETKFSLNRARHMERNKKQTQTFSTLELWK